MSLIYPSTPSSLSPSIAYHYRPIKSIAQSMLCLVFINAMFHTIIAYVAHHENTVFQVLNVAVGCAEVDAKVHGADRDHDTKGRLW